MLLDITLPGSKLDEFRDLKTSEILRLALDVVNLEGAEEINSQQQRHYRVSDCSDH